MSAFVQKIWHRDETGPWRGRYAPYDLVKEACIAVGVVALIALLLTTINSILLNTSALELAADEEIDLNKELRASGLANLLGGFGGGMVGFQSLTLSALTLRMGVKSRVVGLVSAFVCFLLLWFGTVIGHHVSRRQSAGQRVDR